MNESRITLRIDGEDYLVHPGTFQEGAIRRQPEVITLQDTDLKSGPDIRQFWQTSWLGGSQWEQPVYSLQNLDTYYDARNLSMTDRGGAIQVSRATEESDLNATAAFGKVIAWTRNGFDGAVAIVDVSGTLRWDEWDSTTDTWSSTGATHGSVTTNIAAASGGTGDIVYALASNGNVYYWDTSGTTTGSFATGVSIFAGSSLWVDEEYVWIYNGAVVRRYDIDNSYAGELVVNDGDGFDAYAKDADFTGTPVIPKWGSPRAISTSEGIFYVKNVYEGGGTVAKVYRIDRDNAGNYINTPLATLDKGQVAIGLAMHRSSLILSTVGNLFTALDNSEQQRVTLYHITGGSVGAIGSPLGGTNPADTPVYLLGGNDEQFYIGGRLGVWQYDARVGALHPLYYSSAISLRSGAITDLVTVRTSKGTGLMFVAYNQAVSTGMSIILQHDQQYWNLNAGANYLESNWFDFDLPMEVKKLDEFFIDVDDIRGTNDLTVYALADKDGSWTQIAQYSAGDTVGHTTISTDIAGYRFRYRLVFADDVGTETSDPPAIFSLGFKATAGEMYKVIQCTINGWESVNMQNSVQDPDTIYDNLATLRDNADPVSVTHWMKSAKGSESATDTYKVVSVTQRREDPREGLIDVTLMATTPSGRITEA